MIGHSLPEYIFIRCSITLLRLVTPLCATYAATSIYLGRSLFTPLGIYATAEVAFYFLVFLPRLRRLQGTAETSPILTAAERKALFDKCVGCMTDVATRGWFRSHVSLTDTRIRHGNITEWLLWSLFSSESDKITEDWEDEMEYYVSYFGRFLGYTIDSGKNPGLLTIRLSMDPVYAIHRPLLWYWIVGLVDSVTSLLLLRIGFHHYNYGGCFHAFPPRPLLSVFSHKSTEPTSPYWLRPHRSKNKLPLLFLHGIGIGLWPYRSFLNEIIDRDPDIGILAVELLSISMHITSPPPSRDGMCRAIERMLDYHGFDRFIIISHSYGTVLAAHMLHDNRLASRIGATLFVDPIPFLLHHPSVAYNFLYRSPQRANEWQLWYFASRDPDIARVLGRHFHWFESILFREELVGKRVAVSLAGRDQIVDSQGVYQYLTDVDIPVPHLYKDGLEVLYFAELDHAMVFDSKTARGALLDVLERFLAECSY